MCRAKQGAPKTKCGNMLQAILNFVGAALMSLVFIRK